MKPATHMGHCQLCGREQMLPNERLSLHGYSVQWNCFIGTCPGSSHPPYELSCQLLKPAMREALRSAEALRKSASNDRAMVDEIWVEERTKSNRYGEPTKKDWRCLGVERVTFEDGRIAWMGTDGKERSQHLTGADGTQKRLIAAANALHADFLTAIAKNHADYAAWCKGRIAAWRATDLKPVVRKDLSNRCNHLTFQRYGYEGKTRSVRCKSERVPGSFCCAEHQEKERTA